MSNPGRRIRKSNLHRSARKQPIQSLHPKKVVKRTDGRECTVTRRNTCHLCKLCVRRKKLNINIARSIRKCVPHIQRASNTNFTKTTGTSGANREDHRFTALNLYRDSLKYKRILTERPRGARRANVGQSKICCEFPSNFHGSPRYCSWGSCRRSRRTYGVWPALLG